jgi:hypothetical protein
VSHETFRELSIRQDFLAMEIGERYLGGRDEKGFSIIEAIGVSLKFRQLSRADHAFATDKVRWANLDVPMFPCMQIEEELNQGTL